MQGINWTQSLLAALISIVVTVIGGYILYKIQFESPQLIYQVENALPFSKNGENMSIYHIRYENSGNKLAEELITEISINPGKIIKTNIASDSPIEWKTEQDSSRILIKIISLNPREVFKVSFIATSIDSLPKQPYVKLRAKGMAGQKAERNENNTLLSNEKFIFAITIFATFITLFFRAVISSQGIGKQHSDDQGKIMAYLYGIHNLDTEIDRVLSNPDQLSYWSEADRLTSIAINSNDTLKINKAKDIMNALLEYAIIADSTKGIINFNLAKLEKVLGNTASSQIHLDKSKELIPKLIDTRLQLDPILP